MKRILKLLAFSVKWVIILAMTMEVTSFLFITASNYFIYGHAREGSRVRYDPYTLFLRAGGPRPTQYNQASPDPRFNRIIWMFGGSTMKSDTPSDELTLPSLVSKRLNESLAPLRFTVENLGVDSYNSLMEANFLEKQLIETDRHPDLILFYDGANDTTYFNQFRTPYGHYGYPQIRGVIESYYRSPVGVLKPLTAAYYASFTRELIDKTRALSSEVRPDSPELREMVRLTAQRYAFVDRLASCFGADFLLIWQPMLWLEECQVADTVRAQERSAVVSSDRFNGMRQNFTVINHSLSARLAEAPYFTNFTQILCRREMPAYKPDGVHLTDAGRVMVADGMVAEILARGIFHRPAP